MRIVRGFKTVVYFFEAVIFFFCMTLLSLYLRFFSAREVSEVRLVWGSSPIINNVYWSRAMESKGYQSEVYTVDYYSVINKREDWGEVLSEQYNFWPSHIKPYLAFIHAFLKYDVFFIPFSGFFIGGTLCNHLQSFFFKVAKKKVVVIPYGSDSYVYKRIRSTSINQALLMSYPSAAKKQEKIARDVDYWVKNADVIVSGFMGMDGFGRWDVLIPTQLFIDLNVWKKSSRKSLADGYSETVYVAHAPNHRGFKGSEFVIDAVNALKSQGVKVELLLLEKMQNDEVKNALNTKVDILIEQLIFQGHAMNGLEGLASGLPTICNLEDENYLLPFRRWTYFDECPLVSASPEDLKETLLKLIRNPQLRNDLGDASRLYVEKYHGLDSSAYLFENVISFAYGKIGSLVDLYHPLKGKYNKRSPKIEHPLIKNRIVD